MQPGREVVSTSKNPPGVIIPSAGSARGGVWRSLVARLLWEQKVNGSNPFTPTTAPVSRRFFRVTSRCACSSTG